MTTFETCTTESYRELLGEVFDERVHEWTAEAEESERFPRKLIEYLGQSEVFAAKWGERQHPDVAKVFALAEELGKLGSAGIGVGVSLHDSAIAILRRFGKSDYLRDITEQAIRGEAPYRDPTTGRTTMLPHHLPAGQTVRLATFTVAAATRAISTAGADDAMPGIPWCSANQ